MALAKLAVSLHRGVIGLRQGCQRSGDQVRVRILASRHLPTSQTIPHKHASLAPEHLMIIEVMFFNSDLWLPQWFLTRPDLMMLNQIGRDYGSFEKSIAIRTWNFSVQGLWQCLQNQMCVLPIEWTRPALSVVTVQLTKRHKRQQEYCFLFGSNGLWIVGEFAVLPPFRDAFFSCLEFQPSPLFKSPCSVTVTYHCPRSQIYRYFFL